MQMHEDSENVGRSDILRCLLLFLLVIAFSLSAQSQQQKIALLIGNAEYDDAVGELANPTKDIRLIRESLIDVGFDEKNVFTLENGSRADVRRAIHEFANRSRSLSGPDVAFFYYSGHGVSHPESKQTHIVTVDSPALDDSLFWTYPIEIRSEVLNKFASASDAAWIIVFDACRDELKLSPTKGFGEPQRGFDSFPSASGTLVAFAAELGKTASDGEATDRAGPYAVALSQALRLPNRSISEVFSAVRPKVLALTQQQQEPYFEVRLNLAKDLVLNPSEGILTNDESTWRLVEKTGAYEAYLELFPGGAYRAEAEQKIDTRGPLASQSEESVWNKLTLEDWSYKPSNLLLDATLAGATVQAIAAAAVVGDPGDADAKYLLASLFFNGHEEVGVDYAIAFSFYRAACLSGHMRSCAALGNAYDQGLGVGEDDKEAVKYARLACENGVARGCTNLGYHYRRGDGVKADLRRALELYETSCRQQDPLGCTNAGFLAYTGADEVDADKVKAARLWELGCTGGDMLGCTNFGWALSTGEGVGSNPDPVRGLEFHRVACAGGNAQACERVGHALRDGKIVPQDLNEASLAFQRACVLGRESSCSIVSDSDAKE